MLDVSIRKKQGAFSINASFTDKGAGITAIFGRSGAGKTSVINMIAGLVRPDEGRISVNGKTFFDSRQGIDIPTHRRRFGYIFQDGRLFPHLSVKSNLTYGMKLVRPSERYVEFDQVVELLGIGHLLHRRPSKLSGGEKQRVAIGRSLLTSPQLLLMDEPLASLDEERKSEVLPFIGQLPTAFAVPILYVSHSVDEILSLADRAVIMDSGSTVAIGPTDALLDRVSMNGVSVRYARAKQA
ncbi:MAG: molybdenum ABC transporter ATP-binding protein [Desulfomonile tiedjei]|uniref:Molybdenum ABC transporter ATP-binding protein n=1 Tax=Desulfomonile tiedjei TaxID=2358 RepID=A0A9D6V3H3_9BACT|nr:molybdenum ABC transporter ATP-binding protein [Desulfomonile tiedjei]